MASKILFFVSAFCILVLSACTGQQTSPGNNSRLSAFILQKGDSLQKAKDLPGILVATSDSGKRNYYNFGFANPDKKLAFDSATIFEAGSITKTFTALVLKAVLKEKNISDSVPIKNYLPAELKQNESLSAISFLSLLNHTSGLERIPDNMPVAIQNMQPYENYKSENLFSYLTNVKLKPDGKSRYSNTGFALCGMLAEHISGKKYKELLQQIVFNPIRIKAFLHVPDSITNSSQGYFESTKSLFWKFDCMAPAGAVKCSAQDLLQYLEYMSKGKRDTIISSLLQPTVTLNANIKVCRAWHTFEKNDNTLFYWHNGGTYGFSTFAAFSKEKNKAVVVVVNQFNQNAVSDGLGMMVMRKMLE